MRLHCNCKILLSMYKRGLLFYNSHLFVVLVVFVWTYISVFIIFFCWADPSGNPPLFSSSSVIGFYFLCSVFALKLILLQASKLKTLSEMFFFCCSPLILLLVFFLFFFFFLSLFHIFSSLETVMLNCRL